MTGVSANTARRAAAPRKVDFIISVLLHHQQTVRLSNAPGHPVQARTGEPSAFSAELPGKVHGRFEQIMNEFCSPQKHHCGGKQIQRTGKRVRRLYVRKIREALAAQPPRNLLLGARSDELKGAYPGDCSFG